MSVLIKGMKTPENCKKCRCSWYDFTRLFCEADGKPWGLEVTEYADGRHPNCPIIEIPPHGRLIDADALLKLLDSCMFPSDMVTTRALSMATNWLKDAPTVIPADKDGEE